MTLQEAQRVAKKYSSNEITILEIARDLLAANIEGYKEAHTEMNECLARIQAGDPSKEKK